MGADGVHTHETAMPALDDESQRKAAKAEAGLRPLADSTSSDRTFALVAQTDGLGGLRR